MEGGIPTIVLYVCGAIVVGAIILLIKKYYSLQGTVASLEEEIARLKTLIMDKDDIESIVQDTVRKTIPTRQQTQAPVLQKNPLPVATKIGATPTKSDRASKPMEVAKKPESFIKKVDVGQKVTAFSDKKEDRVEVPALQKMPKKAPLSPERKTADTDNDIPTDSSRPRESSRPTDSSRPIDSSRQSDSSRQNDSSRPSDNEKEAAEAVLNLRRQMANIGIHMPGEDSDTVPDVEDEDDPRTRPVFTSMFFMKPPGTPTKGGSTVVLQELQDESDNE